MPIRAKATKVLLTGTADMIPGTALADSVDEDGVPNFIGETKVHWDGQETMTDSEGRWGWTTEDGDTVYLHPSEVENVPDDEEEETLWCETCGEAPATDHETFASLCGECRAASDAQIAAEEGEDTE